MRFNPDHKCFKRYVSLTVIGDHKTFKKKIVGLGLSLNICILEPDETIQLMSFPINLTPVDTHSTANNAKIIKETIDKTLEELGKDWFSIIKYVQILNFFK